MKKNYFKLEVKTKPLFKFESREGGDLVDTDPTTITTVTYTTSFTVLADSLGKKAAARRGGEVLGYGQS